MLAVLTPMLGRGERAAAMLDSLHEATSIEHRCVFLCTPDDPATTDVCHALAADDPACDVVVLDLVGGACGDYARKMNAGARLTSEPYLFLGAVDVRYHARWWDHIAIQLRPGVGVVGTNDLGNPRTRSGRHSTHSLVTRAYIEGQGGTVDGGPGSMLHEGYCHEFVDDELIRTAIWRGAWAHARRSCVEHLHPSWGKAPLDPIYAAQDERMVQGRAVFLSRQHLWGGRIR